MSSRREEIEAKRQRLAELRRQREEKQQRHTRNSDIGVSSPRSSDFGLSRQSIDHLVEELVGDKRTTLQRSISVQTDETIAVKEVPTRITYNKSTQTEEEIVECEEDDVTEEVVPESTPETEPEEPTEETEPTVEPIDDSALASFFSKSFKIINRAIEEDANHDILITYAQKKKKALEEAQPYLLLDSLKLETPARSIDTSPFFPDLIIISTETTIRLYNTAFRVFEHQFQAQTQIVQVQFSHFQSNFIFGTGYNGKLHIWDLDSPTRLPHLTSPVTSSTHSYPVYSLDQVNENNGMIITASTDGKILHWDPQILTRPASIPIQLKVPKSLALRYDELTPWCVTHLKDDHGFLIVGAEDGNVYKVKRFDKVNSDAIDKIFVAHSGPVTALEGSKEFSQLFISSGMDWRVFLWDLNNDEPILEIYKSNSVMSVSWRPGNPTQVGYIYEDVFEVMDLSVDPVIPVLKMSVGKTLCGVRFSKEGDKVLLSTLDGQVLIYELLLQDVKSDLSKFKRLYLSS